VVESEVDNAATKRGQTMLYNDAMILSTNFTLSVDVKPGSASAWGGVVFHYQNASNYYAARIKGDVPSYQIIRVLNGAAATVISKNDALEAFSTANFYTITVISDNAGNFTMQITRQGQSTVLNPATSGRSSSFTDGYAGLYNSAYAAALVDYSYDNFNLKSAPATLKLFVIH
jgi:hypothetical protein